MKVFSLKFTFLVLGFLLILPFGFVRAGTILSDYKYAWSNNVGYINFSNVTVGNSALSGYAWSSNYGWINLAPAQGGVSNDGSGNLSGSAWGQQLGWIDFNGVSINPSTGVFSGTATGDIIGTLTFNCGYCDVRTDWTGGGQSSQSSVSSGGVTRRFNQITQLPQNFIGLLNAQVATLVRAFGVASVSSVGNVSSKDVSSASYSSSTVVSRVGNAKLATSSTKTRAVISFKQTLYRFIDWLRSLLNRFRY